jgi:hypothetical protein
MTGHLEAHVRYASVAQYFFGNSFIIKFLVNIVLRGFRYVDIIKNKLCVT